MPFPNTTPSRHDLTGSAETALKGVMLNERGLQRMQGITVRQPFYRGDLPALRHHGQGGAAENASAVHMHGASAAFPAVTALLGTRESNAFSQSVEQRDARLHGNGV